MFIIKLLILTTALTLNCLVFVNYYLKYKHEEEQNVKNLAKEIADLIDISFDKYKITLNNLKGLINIKNELSPEEFNKYTNTIDFNKNYLGSTSYGFIRYIKSEDLKNYTKEKGNIKIFPIVKTNEHMIIELIEPLDKNPNFKWKDISYDSLQKYSALRSEIRNEFTLTPPLNLSLSKEKNLGFYAYLPVFDPTGPNPKYFLKGWVFTSIVLDKFLKEIDRKIPSNVKIQIEFSNSDLVYAGGFSKFISNSKFYKNYSANSKQIGGYSWKIKLTADSEKFHHFIYLLASLFLVSSITIMLLTFKIFNLIIFKNKLIYQKDSWFKGVINSSNYLIISTNIDGKIISFNTAAERCLQYQPKEVIGKETPLLFHDLNELKLKLIPDNNNFNSISLFSFFIKSIEKIDLNHCTFIRKDGSKFLVKLFISSISDQFDNCIGYLFTAEDLTQSIETQKIIDDQKEQMIYTSKFSQLGEMSANIAHEINTPLSVILVKSYSLKNKIIENKFEYEVFIKDLEKIENTTQKVAKIVKSLKMYTRNSDNDKYERISLNSILLSTLDLCNEKIKHNNITLYFTNDKPYMILGKEAELCQVFLNLINNSIDAIANLKEKWIEIKIKEDKSIYYISFTDSGNGIPLDIVENLMKPFFTTKQVGKGTGLGLSISKRIIEMHKGKLYYDNNNKHTSFIIELPTL